MKGNLFVAIVSVILGSLITIVGQPYVNQYVEGSKTPVLLKKFDQTNIENLSDDVKKQISLVTTRYSLRQIQGGTAEDLTVKVTSTNDLPISNFVIDKNSETNSVIDISKTFKKIEVKSIRPNGLLSMEITHAPDNKITIEEIVKLGYITDNEIEKIESSMQWWQYLLLALLAVFWGGVIYLAYLAIVKTINHFSIIESGLTEPDKKGFPYTLAIIVGFLITLSIVSRLKIIPLPTVNVSEFFYAVMLYLIVSNYEKIKKIIDKLAK